MSQQTETDEFIGETFLDLDSRSDSRRIRIVEPARSVAGKRRWRAVITTNDGNPSTVGRHVTVNETTLRDRYRQVSR